MTFENILAKDGKLVYKTRGVSMEPMLRQNRDLVVIQVPSLRLKRLDVALYKREEKYVLHRVIKVKDGYYLIRGDNTYVIEKVPDEAVIGVLASFKRKGKDIEVTDKKYRAYAALWQCIYPARFLVYTGKRIVARILRKMGILDKIKKRNRSQNS